MTSATTKIDRAALVRRALVELVAENGFRGTSMAAVAAKAGVATGTAYVHYGSKDELVLAAYVEVKRELGESAFEKATGDGTLEQAFIANWKAMYSHLAADPVRARFLLQVEASPYAAAAHQAAIEAGAMVDLPRMDEMMETFVDLPPLILWDISAGPAIRAAAAQRGLSTHELDTLAHACWRAASRP